MFSFCAVDPESKMPTLKKMALLNIATELFNETDTRYLIYWSQIKKWNQFVRKKFPENCIPLKLQKEIIALMKPIEFDVSNWLGDHEEIFSFEQKMSIKLCWKSDGTVDRIKTAYSLINSECLDVHTRFVLACQYWHSSNVLSIFNKVDAFTMNHFLEESAKEHTYRNEHLKNVDQWIRNQIGHCRRNCDLCRCWCRTFNWTHVSLQGTNLNHLTAESQEFLLRHAFDETLKIHVGRFCLSKMTLSHRDQLLKFYPLKVLRICLFWPYQKFFMLAVNKVWDCLTGNDFICILHIIICQKILAYWEDFHYVDLLRQFWSKTPDHLKKLVDGICLHQVLINIIDHGLPSEDVPTHYYLHNNYFYENAMLCDDMVKSVVSD